MKNNAENNNLRMELEKVTYDGGEKAAAVRREELEVDNIDWRDGEGVAEFVRACEERDIKLYKGILINEGEILYIKKHKIAIIGRFVKKNNVSEFIANLD